MFLYLEKKREEDLSIVHRPHCVRVCVLNFKSRNFQKGLSIDDVMPQGGSLGGGGRGLGLHDQQ